MIRWTGLAPWEFEVPFPDNFTSTFLCKVEHQPQPHVRSNPEPDIPDPRARVLAYHPTALAMRHWLCGLGYGSPGYRRLGFRVRRVEAESYGLPQALECLIPDPLYPKP